MTGQRWEIRDGGSGVTLAELHGTHFNKRTAARIAADIATVIGVSVTQPMLRTGPLRNPTLVHHGYAQRASYHVVGPSHQPLADLYVGARQARRIAQEIADDMGIPISLLENDSVPRSTELARHPTTVARPRSNPKRKGRENPSRSAGSRARRGARRSTLRRQASGIGGRRVVRALSSGDVPRAQYLALQSKYRYRRRHPAVNPKGDAWVVWEGKYLLTDEGEQTYPNLGRVRMFLATGKRGATYGATLYDDGRFHWINVSSRGRFGGSVPFDLAQVSPERLIAGSPKANPKSRKRPWIVGGRTRYATREEAMAAASRIHQRKGVIAAVEYDGPEPMPNRRRRSGARMTRKVRRAVASGRFVKARHHAAATVARGVRRLDLQRRFGFPVGREGVKRNPNPKGRKSVMDRATAEHFYAWLEKTVHASDQHQVEQQIHQLLRDHPDLVDKGRSWPEMRALAERNYPSANRRKRHPKGRTRQTAGVRGRARSNPRESAVAQGRRTFRRLNEIEPGKVTKVKTTRGAPKVMVKLGELVSLRYKSDKYAGSPDNPDGKTLLYEHETRRPRPVISTDPSGREVHIVGGRMRPTPDGLIN